MGQVKQMLIAAREEETELDMEAIRLKLLAQGAFTDIDESDREFDDRGMDGEPGYYESRYPFLF